MTEQPPVFLNNLGIVCSLGTSLSTVNEHLFTEYSDFLAPSDTYTPGRRLPLGQVKGNLPTLHNQPLKWQSRNNQLLLAAYQQIEPAASPLIAKFGAQRVGIVIGTSTSGIAEGERGVKTFLKTGTPPADYDYQQQEMASPAEFLAHYTGARGPVFSISTACSSGAKALASAQRLINSDLCDVVLAGGADALCGLTINGFNALELVSEEVCNPFGESRKGINIGEGAGLFLVSRLPGSVVLLSAGETSDAYHFSSPAPEGRGAKAAMLDALNRAEVLPEQVTYINLHGTGTSLNDKMEAAVVKQIFGEQTLCSSTKTLTGHTLGAAGAIEAGFCWLILKQTRNHQLPLQHLKSPLDPHIDAINLVSKTSSIPHTIDYVMSNSFAFGGNNIALLFGRT